VRQSNAIRNHRELVIGDIVIALLESCGQLAKRRAFYLRYRLPFVIIWVLKFCPQTRNTFELVGRSDA
jgi:hypothetical protein